MAGSGDRFNRRVSTKIRYAFTPKGISRIWTSTRAGEHTKDGRYLPVQMLQFVGKMPTAHALKYVARKAGVPRARAGTLYWNPKEGQWWLVTNF